TGGLPWCKISTPRGCSSTARLTRITNPSSKQSPLPFSHAAFAPAALEIDDASEVRIDKVFKIIGECKFGIHDISRTEVSAASNLPRFNMPLELGRFLAAKRFGVGKQNQKVCLILDSTPF